MTFATFIGQSVHYYIRVEGSIGQITAVHRRPVTTSGLVIDKKKNTSTWYMEVTPFAQHKKIRSHIPLLVQLHGPLFQIFLFPIEILIFYEHT